MILPLLGVVAGYLASVSKGTPANIGKMKKSRFVDVYKSPPAPEVGWKGVTNIAFAQNKPGVYLIKRDDTLVYVGASGNDVYRKSLRHFQPYKIRDSNQGHHKQDFWSDFDKYRYTIRIVLCDNQTKAYRLEAALIHKYHPVYNATLPSLNFNGDNVLNEYENSPF
jgi:hypothetical protein